MITVMLAAIVTTSDSDRTETDVRAVYATTITVIAIIVCCRVTGTSS